MSGAAVEVPLRWSGCNGERGIGVTRSNAAAVGVPGFVAVGAAMRGEAGDPGVLGAWTSVDGLAWLPSTFEAAAFSELHQAVVWDGDRFVAFSRPGLDEEVWMSADGTDWRRLAAAPDVAIDGLYDGCTGGICPGSTVIGAAAAPGAVVAFGARHAIDGTSDALVWVSPRLVAGP